MMIVGLKTIKRIVLDEFRHHVQVLELMVITTMYTLIYID
jgi:hypothetical protein